MIKAGDSVRVTDWFYAYSRADEWFTEHLDDLEIEWLIKYAYGCKPYIENKCDDNTKYRVLYVDECEKACLITHANGRSDYIYDVYLIKLDGVELYDKPTEMTIAEIEEKLGIRNLKIVKEDK